MKIENFVKYEPEFLLGEKNIENMLPTKVCMFYELSETILLFGPRYLHLDLFQFLHRCLSLHVQFCLYVFLGKIVPSSHFEILQGSHTCSTKSKRRQCFNVCETV